MFSPLPNSTGLTLKRKKGIHTVPKKIRHMYENFKLY